MKKTFIDGLVIVIILIFLALLLIPPGNGLDAEITKKCRDFVPGETVLGDYPEEIAPEDIIGRWTTEPRRGFNNELEIGPLREDGKYALRFRTATCCAMSRFTRIGEFDLENKRISLDEPTALAFGEAFQTIVFTKHNEELSLKTATKNDVFFLNSKQKE